MSEPLKDLEKNTADESGSTKPDTDAIRMEMGEIQEILRGLRNKHGAIVQVRAAGDLVILVVRFPGTEWKLSEKEPHTLLLNGKAITDA